MLLGLRVGYPLCNKWGGVRFFFWWGRVRGGQMVCGLHGMRERWNTGVSWCVFFYAFLHIWFTSCSRIVSSFCVFLDVEHRSVFRKLLLEF